MTKPCTHPTLAGATLWAAVVAAGGIQQAGFEPPDVVAAVAPDQPPLAIGGGEVLVQVGIDPGGAIERVDVIRSTPPFTDLVTEAVRAWTFVPARAPNEDGAIERVASKALVVGLFRPPQLFGGPTLGQPPEEVGVSSPEVPYPSALTPPAYPVNAIFGAIVVLALDVGETGAVERTAVVLSGGDFDAYAREAVRTWSFRPAMREGRAIPSLVVAIVGFRPPVLED